jgi:hypothetical protein
MNARSSFPMRMDCWFRAQDAGQGAAVRASTRTRSYSTVFSRFAVPSSRTATGWFEDIDEQPELYGGRHVTHGGAERGAAPPRPGQASGAVVVAGCTTTPNRTRHGPGRGDRRSGGVRKPVSGQGDPASSAPADLAGGRDGSLAGGSLLGGLGGLAACLRDLLRLLLARMVGLHVQADGREPPAGFRGEMRSSRAAGVGIELALHVPSHDDRSPLDGEHIDIGKGTTQ